MKKLKFDKKSQNENGYPLPSLCFHDLHLLFFDKHLGSDNSLQSYLHFQDFCGSKLLNICLVVWPNNLFLREMQ